ncbi:hypothetical protein LGT39_08115 [Demequina sp. TTPB684]|uniref:hypothetical protein n=1 Tax=unclassified Demequina TaxID=2620311 RepID=UPI001CF44212|nr:MULTISPECIES: hypothetical protein [unclassified Demequina]MCB2412809.1 hypothetical protein [Demequina sp. TTPB684]UPU87445.1 hypothetical protein LGT36_009225 [Demequina sp. TMPB413]
MAKKKNSRKALAVALGIMGVAGLSVASASQLTLNVNDDNIAVGTNTFAAACDDAVTIDYTYDLPTGKYTNLVISDIDAGCVGNTLEYTLSDDSPASIVSDTVTVVAPVAPATTSTVTVSISTVDLTTTLGSIDVAIY